MPIGYFCISFFALFFSGGCRFSVDLVFTFGKVTVVLSHDAFLFSESTHKYLNLEITVLFDRPGILSSLLAIFASVGA